MLCTIVKTEGSTPLKTGAQMLVRIDGSISGTIGGGALEHAVIQQARAAIASGGQSQLARHQLTHDHKMCCGGTVHIFMEAIGVPPQCFIFGAGHIGKALAALVSTLDFEVILIDGRPNMLGDRVSGTGVRGPGTEFWRSDFPDYPGLRTPDPGPRTPVQLIQEEPDKAVSSLIWDSATFAVIATHSHSLDREILRLALAKPFRYCGMIGSNRKVLVTRKLFLERGWATEEELDRIDMPIGIEIAAQAPAEIAVSIAARMIEVQNSSKPLVLSPESEVKDLKLPQPQGRIQSLSHATHPLTSDCTNDFACTTATL